LGESIVAIGVSATATAYAHGDHLGTELVIVVGLGLLITAAMWWTYFDRFAEIAEESLRTHRDPVIAAADGYSYIHLVIVAGIIIFAAGVRLLVAHPGIAPSDSVRLALCGGVATYIVGHVAFGLRMTRMLGYPKLIIVAGLLILYAAGGGLSGVALTAIITALLAALCGFERLAISDRLVARI
jgi:low temperature requirement protein LtrA